MGRCEEGRKNIIGLKRVLDSASGKGNLICKQRLFMKMRR